MDGFLKSALAARIMELIRGGVQNVEEVLKTEVEDSVNSEFTISLNTDIDKLNKVVYILKANAHTAEVDFCITVLEEIINNFGDDTIG